MLGGCGGREGAPFLLVTTRAPTTTIAIKMIPTTIITIASFGSCGTGFAVDFALVVEVDSVDAVVALVAEEEVVVGLVDVVGAGVVALVAIGFEVEVVAGVVSLVEPLRVVCVIGAPVVEVAALGIIGAYTSDASFMYPGMTV